MTERKPVYKIQENFLNKNDFKKIKDVMTNSGSFPWYYSQIIGAKYKSNIYFSYFIHTFYDNNSITSPYIKLIEPFLKKLKVKKLIRAKVNLFYPTNRIIKFDEHQDTNYKSDAAILYLNDCNGGTIIKKDNFIQSKENRLLKFKGNLLHQSTSCSDDKYRILININYEKYNRL
tara:strand:- start:224 stop:745 length:522 start_codon:yes stop_codon:yes gene_type:complete